MIDPHRVPPIAEDELLARFIVNSNEVRADGTVRPQLFLPYKHIELSVNRHRDATLDEPWAIGRLEAIEGYTDRALGYDVTGGLRQIYRRKKVDSLDVLRHQYLTTSGEAC